MNKNSLFFVKLLSVTAAVFLIIGTLNYYYIHDYYYLDVYGEVDSMKNVPDGITMANFGTSHGLASFRYPDNTNGEVCYNFALSGEDIYHDFQTLKQFSNHLAKGCIVALPTSYFSFCMSTEAPSQKRYYLYLDKEYIRDFSYETLINAKYLPVLRSGEFIIKNLINDQDIDVGGIMMANDKKEAQIKTAFMSFTQETAAVDTVEDEEQIKHLESHAAGRAVSWRSGYMITGRKYMQENSDILAEMIEYCKDNDFKPVLVTTPIYKALNSQFSDAELKECYFDNVRKVAAKTGVPYLDLSHDSELSENPEYFGNSDHMSETGAKEFLERYFAFLRTINYI